MEENKMDTQDVREKLEKKLKRLKDQVEETELILEKLEQSFLKPEWCRGSTADSCSAGCSSILYSGI